MDDLPQWSYHRVKVMSPVCFYPLKVSRFRAAFIDDVYQDAEGDWTTNVFIGDSETREVRNISRVRIL